MKYNAANYEICTKVRMHYHSHETRYKNSGCNAKGRERKIVDFK